MFAQQRPERDEFECLPQLDENQFGVERLVSGPDAASENGLHDAESLPHFCHPLDVDFDVGRHLVDACPPLMVPATR